MNERNGTVLVTGAGGFIGGRVVELFHIKYGYQVRANIRKWAKAARIGRFPIDMRVFDINNENELRKGMNGVDYVVHCAVGSPEDTVDGTRLLLRVTKEFHVKKFIHLSTVEVYDSVQTGVIEEGAPIVKNGDQYGDLKVEAEKLCWESIKQGLPVVILRPSIVYGIFSKYWSVRPVERMTSGYWMLPNGVGNGQCNLIYVDDLVASIHQCIQNDESTGKAFNINSSENVTWREYFSLISDSIGKPLATPSNDLGVKVANALLRPIKFAVKLVLGRLRPIIFKLYERYHVAKVVMKRAETILKSSVDPSEQKLFEKNVRYSNRRAIEILHFSPTPVRDGLRVTAEWLKFSGYLS
ncbi:MAG: NAD-dependent epimerase/dehydratase family protein [Bacteroidota bacterium]